ncbi:receptor-like protein 6 [Bidens hawaiensis]|uniref:receptor-like protein 6 n=1 Tax=Bidens hawaiensis TaxID=980011 RepID=UPI00404B8C36
MGSSKLVLSFSFLFFISYSKSSFSLIHKCSDEQRDALLVFKQNISSMTRSHALHGSRWYDQVKMNWNTSIDCCDWDGITCNNFTGDVISLKLGCGLLQGVVEPDILLSRLPKLEAIDLSYSGLSVLTKNVAHEVNPNFLELSLVACNLTVFPNFLGAMKNLKILDLSSNFISGLLPDWTSKIGGNKLTYLDLSYNSITGLSEFVSAEMQYLYMRSNLIEGPFPPWICNMGRLLYLDMSNNSFHGVIPRCFGKITSSLAMINLGINKFHGIIPNLYGDCGLLLVLILEENNFEGEVPSSLVKCKSLKILDMGNNRLYGTFPRWLGDLPKLQVLNLRSNSLHGTIETPTMGYLFPSLSIFDVSNNGFVGNLPGKYLENFNAIKDLDKHPKTELVYTSGSYYSIIPLEGSKFFSPKIVTTATVIDLSSNKFEGDIPNVIGNLKSLMALNLSNNNLTGQIPHVLGDIFDMEALDLSRNQLIGEIPQSLENLTFLELLNLSQNHLTGHIPENRQFSLFTNDSYFGNPDLCGPPLTRECKDLSSPKVKAKWICMEAVMLGLGCGTLVGVVWGYRMLSTETPKWLTAIANAGGHIARKKRKHVHLRKRN